MTKARLSRFLIPAISAMFVFALACGGSSDDGGDEGAGDNPSPTPTTSSSSSSGNTDLDPDTAVVTIGDKTYEFTMTNAFADSCLTLFGFVGGNGTAKDGSDVRADIEIPPDDWETDDRTDWDTPSIRISDDETNQDWRAGGDIVESNEKIPASSSRVNDFTNDGNVAKGSATFIDYRQVTLNFATGEIPDPVEGTFEIYCE